MFDVKLGVDAQEVWVQASQEGASAQRHVLGTLDVVEGFTKRVGAAVRYGVKFDDALLSQAHDLHQAFFQGAVSDALTLTAANELPFVRLIVEDPRLQKVPWEALCKPGTSEDFLAMGTRFAVARGITSTEPVTSRKIDTALRLLVIAPQEHEAGVQGLRNALRESIESEAIEWLDPVRGERATTFRILDRLRTGALPHIIHFIGHGGMDATGHPILRLADDEDGDDVWIKAETLGQELKANFCGELRLVVLEACEGAIPGMFGSAAEIITRAGADAVVSYLWPVRAAASREASKAFYRTLTAGQTGRGDVLSSVGAARRTLLSESSGGFSLIAHLRGSTTKLFDLAAKLEQPKAPFTVPFLQDKRFVGRRDDLKKLHGLLQREAPIGVNAVTGMGGIGKTQLVVEYAYRHRGDYPGGVYWVNAAADWQSELARLAEKIGIRDQSSSEHERQKWLALAFVRHLELHPGALVIFDNVEDPLELQNASRDIVPARLPCRLLFTTRRQTPTYQVVDVRSLDEADALRLLLETPTRRRVLESGAPQELATAKSICKTLGYLPLALALASAHLDKSPRITLEGYLRGIVDHGALLITDHAKVDPRELATQHAKAVRATLEEQWATLREEKARRALQAAAVLGEAEQIPRARLSLLTGLSDEPEDWRDAPLEEALRELIESSLVEVLTESVLRLHPLVREFGLWKLGGERERFGEACAERMADALYDMGRLSNEVERRGVDEVLDDLRVGIELGEPERLANLLRPMDRQAHIVKSRNLAENPGFFLQQLRNQALELAADQVTERADTRLSLQDLPYLRERFAVGAESQALIRTLADHVGGVNSVAITADSRFAVSASRDRTCKVWDLRMGIVMRTFSEHSSEVIHVALTSNGKLVVSNSADGKIKVWELETGKVLHELGGHAHSIRHLHLPKSADFVIATLGDGTARVWNIETGKLLVAMYDRQLWMYACVGLPARRQIVALTNAGLVSWDTQTRQIVAHQRDNRTLSLDGVVAVSADEQLIFTRLRHDFATIIGIYDVDARSFVRQIRIRSHDRSCLAISPNAQRILTASDRHAIDLWDGTTGALLHSYTGHTGPVNHVAASEDGRIAVSGSADGSVKIWDLEIEKFGVQRLPVAAEAESITCVACAPGIALLGFQKQITDIRDHVSYEESRRQSTLKSSGRYGTYGMAVSPEGDLVLSVQTTNGCIAAIRIDSDHPQTPEWVGNEARQEVNTGQPKRGSDSATENNETTILVRDLRTGAIERMLSGHTARITCIAFAQDGNLAISGALDQTIRVWDVTAGVTIRSFGTTPVCAKSVVFSADGKQVIYGASNWELRVLNLETGKVVDSWVVHRGEITAVAVTRNGRWVVSGSTDSSIRVVNRQTCEIIGGFTGHTGPVYGVAITPDDRFVIAVCWDRTLRIWELETGKQVAMLEAHAPLLCCAVSSDGKTILAGDQAGGLHVLDWHRGNLRRDAKGPT
ncbi:MAG TPA: CHAT domain-containing protein [Polyangium sp.]|nr:CHAT domain-containing protein [Polyangium sp.]